MEGEVIMVGSFLYSNNSMIIAVSQELDLVPSVCQNSTPYHLGETLSYKLEEVLEMSIFFPP